MENALVQPSRASSENRRRDEAQTWAGLRAKASVLGAMVYPKKFD
jgi:hypothetical protein